MSQSNRGGDLLLALFLGALSGAIIALLATPQSGRELRSNIKNKSTELPEEFKSVLSETKNLYSKMDDFLRTVAAEKGAMAQDVWNQKSQEAKSVFAEQKQKVQSALNEASRVIKSKLSHTGGDASAEDATDAVSGEGQEQS